MTRRSENSKKIRSGDVDDLEYATVPDGQIKEDDLFIIEREINKKKRKRVKDQKNGDMMSPKTS